MSEAEIAWLAGILEGEGSFMAWIRTRGDRGVRIQMGSTDKDILDRIADMVSIGTVRLVPAQHNKFGTKPLWIWALTSKTDVRILAQRLLPWLGERRRKQAEAIIESTEGLLVRPGGVCSKGHLIEGENRLQNGRSAICRTCANERRRAQSSAR